MRAVVQRVKEARVEVAGVVKGSIKAGLLVFVGIGRHDGEGEAEWMVDKIINLRIFETEEGKLDKSLLDIDGELLLVSQFTLYGDCSKGRRPSFSDAMPAEEARKMFALFVEKARRKTEKVETGVFQADMEVFLVNDGPVTMIIERTVSSL
ncbi:MAG TPA: D-aminoacyl-tRNA deacylase [Syntrophorhabdaceae bacterium]|jgi:D-tyrosyl-tRNA(Tyr) deacylase